MALEEEPRSGRSPASEESLQDVLQELRAFRSEMQKALRDLKESRCFQPPSFAVNPPEAIPSGPEQSSNVKHGRRIAGLLRTEPSQRTAGNLNRGESSSAVLRRVRPVPSGASAVRRHKSVKSGSGLKALEKHLKDELLAFKVDVNPCDSEVCSSLQAVVPAVAWGDSNPRSPKASRQERPRVSFHVPGETDQERPPFGEIQDSDAPNGLAQASVPPAESQGGNASSDVAQASVPPAESQGGNASSDVAQASPAAVRQGETQGHNDLARLAPPQPRETDLDQPTPGPRKVRSFRASLDQVQRKLQRGIVANNVSPREDEVGPVPNDTPSWLSSWAQTAGRVANYISMCCLRVSGIIPWSGKFFWLSLFYQVAVLLVHSLLLGFFLHQVSIALADSFERSAVNDRLLVPMLTNSFVAFGNVGALVALQTFKGSPHAVSCLENLTIFSVSQDTEDSVDVHSGFDFVITFAAWVYFVGAQSCTLFEDPSRMEIMEFAASILSSGELLSWTLLVLRFTRHMSASIDSFCGNFLQQSDYSGLVSDWNVVQALVRTSSAAIEGCFVALQSTLVLTTLVLVCDVLQHRVFEWNAACAVVLVCALMHVLVRGTAITDACTRVPQLINSSCLTEDEMDPERSYLVEYIEASAPGFYIYNVRLGSSTATRVLHQTLLLGVTIARLF